MKKKILNLLRQLLFPLFKKLITVYSQEHVVTIDMLVGHDNRHTVERYVQKELAMNMAYKLLEDGRFNFKTVEDPEIMGLRIHASIKIF